PVCRCQVAAQLRPHLGPTIKGAAQEAERVLRHTTVFELQVAFDNTQALLEPAVIRLGRLDDVHEALIGSASKSVIVRVWSSSNWSSDCYCSVRSWRCGPTAWAYPIPHCWRSR